MISFQNETSKNGGSSLLLLLSLSLGSSPVTPFLPSARAAEFSEDIERDIPLRSNGKLRILNNRGDIVIEGWSQDKIRLNLKRKTQAADLLEAQRLFASAEVLQRVVDGNVEITAEYGHGLSLQERLRERDSPKTSMEISMLAPAGRPLQILALKGKVTLKSWRGAVEIRSSSGEIQIENVKAGDVFILCPSCTIQAKGVQASLRSVGGDRGVTLESVSGGQVYIETELGTVQARKIQGDQLYVSKAGGISVQDAKGNIEFYSRDAAVEMTGINGSVNGRSESGNIKIKMSNWLLQERAFIESMSGSILLGVPRGFAAEVDLFAEQGKLQVDLPMISSNRRLTSGASEQNSSVEMNSERHRIGSINHGTDQLKVYSEKGDIWLGFTR